MQVKTLIKKLPLSLSPLESYKRLCANGTKPHSILLETAEAGTHVNHKSIIGISSAIEIKAIDEVVTIRALNGNGKAFVNAFDTSRLSQFDIQFDNDSVILRLKPQKISFNEDERLAQASSLTVLRHIKEQLKSYSQEDDVSSYLLGAFSFDLVDKFEVLPDVEKLDEDHIFNI